MCGPGNKPPKVSEQEAAQNEEEQAILERLEQIASAIRLQDAFLRLLNDMTRGLTEAIEREEERQDADGRRRGGHQPEGQHEGDRGHQRK